MPRTRRILVVVVLIASATLPLWHAVAHAHAPTVGRSTAITRSCSDWHLFSSPQPSGASSYALNAVSAGSSVDVWAVGDWVSASTGNRQTLVQHWNGTTWSIVASPNAPAVTYNVLASVASLSSSNVWAVGASRASTDSTLIEHYNSTSWSIVSSPNLSGSNDLYGVAANSASDIWAVGINTNTPSVTQPLIEHYNGTTRSVASTPTVSSSFAELDGVAATSSQAWAAGDYTDTSGVYHTLVEHYDGTSWSVAPSLDVGTTGSTLGTVTAVSPTNVWAAGFTQDVNGNSTGGLVEHWNGTSWSVAQSNTTLPTYLWAIASVPNTSWIWTAGDYTTSSTTDVAYAERWTGTTWQSAAPVSVASTQSDLVSLDAVSATDVWVVGFGRNASTGTSQAIIEHYSRPMGITCGA